MHYVWKNSAGMHNVFTVHYYYFFSQIKCPRLSREKKPQRELLNAKSNLNVQIPFVRNDHSVYNDGHSILLNTKNEQKQMAHFLWSRRANEIKTTSITMMIVTAMTTTSKKKDPRKKY